MLYAWGQQQQDFTRVFIFDFAAAVLAGAADGVGGEPFATYLDGWSEQPSGVRNKVTIELENISASPPGIYVYGYRVLPSGVISERRVLAADFATADTDILFRAYNLYANGRHWVWVSSASV